MAEDSPSPHPEMLAHLGPLAALVGIWEGAEGVDISPAKDGSKETHFRERMTFEPIGEVNNHEQSLYGLRYATQVWRIGADSTFHEEVGYWLWDAADKQVIRCFIVPRGNTVMAGGTVEADARSFEMIAEVGSETYGICSNKFLAEEFRTVRFEVNITIHDKDSFSYDEDTVLQIKGQDELFHHRDSNTLQRVS